MREVSCPYCHDGFDVDADDPRYYQEDESIPTECPSCFKTILVIPSITYSYDAEEADCLNGSPHDWSEWLKHHPVEDFTKWFATRRCQTCDEKEQTKLDVTDNEDEQRRLQMYKDVEARVKN